MRSISAPPLLAGLFLAAAVQAAPASPPKPGVAAVQRPFSGLKPSAVFKLGATADWVEVTPDAVWVGASGPDAVVKLDPRTNAISARTALPGAACAGLASGFGRLWVPLCGRKGAANGLAEVDLADGRLVRVLPTGPAAEEGGIAASPDSVWLLSDKTGSLVRINPGSGHVRQTVHLHPGSYNPIYAAGVIWVSCIDADLVTAVDASTGRILGETRTGPRPRFLTTGAGSVWTLDQGDGSATRIDARSRRPVARIAVGIPGHGGDIAYGGGEVWTTVADVPLSAIDPATNAVRRQWVGPGGDALRVGFGSIWITDYHAGTIARMPLTATHTP
ncbi:MAG: hypothetical protein WA840_24490 [Caulobacteraceae bacterium]